ncbi:MAG: hypothetical protein N2050_01085 [Flavobacteriales bacterium]|nr:hypothetical protein [Flavobacteriales bacterium]
MNYDIKLINNYEGKGRIELARLEFLAKHLRSIAQKTLLLHLFGYSKVSLPAYLKKYLHVFLTHTKGEDGSTVLTLDTDDFRNIPVQLSLFEEKTALHALTPMALVIQSFAEALSDSEEKNSIDAPLLEEMVKFKKFFQTDSERVLLSNRSTIPAVELSRKEIDKIEGLFKKIPAPEKIIVTGVLDEMKYSREQVILNTSDNKRVVVLVSKNLFDEIKDFFGKEVTIVGVAHYKPGGQLSYVKGEKFAEADEHEKNMFSKKPHKMSVQQQLALQLREGKKPNPIDDIFGKWPGDESDEDFEKFLKALRE